MEEGLKIEIVLNCLLGQHPPVSYEDTLEHQLDRVNLETNNLQLLEVLFREIGITDFGYCVGGMTDAQLKSNFSKQILLATYQLVSEGFDVPTLNTMVLASPISSIEQPIGRIQRQKPSERTYIPWVIDVIDEFSIFENQGRRRLQFYKKNNYEILDTKPEVINRIKKNSNPSLDFRSEDED